ncbi:MAG: hypothetical protein O3B04_04250 [Chloroflexi bacterium]|nr:hypothetical protein [Chloroflexota bacterium]MDA1297200.1 hypothetical protein [Chloroflexota bacterium]
MNVELRTPGESHSPGYVFRKWVLIGAIGGAALVGVAGALALGVVMIGGAAAGAVVGVAVGAVKAALAAFGRG